MDSYKTKPSSVKLVICGQLFGIAIFLVGLTIGLCIGIFVFNKSPSSTMNNKTDYHKEKHDTQAKYKNISMLDSTKKPVRNDDLRNSEGNQLLESELPDNEESGIQLMPPCKRCVWSNPIRPQNRPNLFAPLSAEEMILAHKSLLKHNKIDVDYGEEISFKSNFIATMFLNPPPKKAVFKYMDGDGKFPGRFATVVVVRGNIDQADYMQYKVGPLEGTESEVLIEQLLRDGEVPYESRPYDNVEIGEIILSVLADLEKISPLLKESFDVNDVYQDITVMPNGPYNDGSGRISRFTLGLRGLGNKEFDFLNILPFHANLFHGGQNVSNWYTFDYYYVNQGPFSNVTHLMEEYMSGQLKYIEYPEGYKDYITRTTVPVRDIYSKLRPNSQHPGTSTYEPHGPRYTVEGHAVNWLGWSFTVSTGQHRGPSIFDVRFNGERVLYENSLNEIALVYSADGSGQDNMVYLDTVYGLGESKRAIPRVDCPVYATYLNSSGWDPNQLRPVLKPTFCVFEVDGQEPLWRHKGVDIEAGLNNNYLVARYPTQVGNYDYIIDFQFYLDGRMKTLVSATGFIQGSFWNPSSNVNTPFGYRVSDSLIGPIHDHTFGFKVDLDVAGKENDFQIVHWKAGDVKTILKDKNDTSYFLYNQSRFIEWEHIDKETGLKINSENQNFWTVINKNKKNRYGVDRGYRIIPMATSAQNLPESYPRMKELSFTKYHCAVTKQKDNEQYLKPLYFPVYNRTREDISPTQLYLQDMMDGEPLENDDIVAWLSVGFLHVPTSEDVPMTIRVQSGFLLKPFNFFDRTATFDVPALIIFNNTVLDNAPVPDMCYSEPSPIGH